MIVTTFADDREARKSCSVAWRDAVGSTININRKRLESIVFTWYLCLSADMRYTVTHGLSSPEQFVDGVC